MVRRAVFWNGKLVGWEGHIYPSALANSALAPGSLWTWLVFAYVSLAECCAYVEGLSYYEDGDVELLGHVCELGHHLSQLLLASEFKVSVVFPTEAGTACLLGELATPAEVHAEAGHDAVDNLAPVVSRPSSSIQEWGVVTSEVLPRVCIHSWRNSGTGHSTTPSDARC